LINDKSKQAEGKFGKIKGSFKDEAGERKTTNGSKCHDKELHLVDMLFFVY
jgi:uncharacterized protein YjbJ (UPF0337 family)